MRAWSPTDMQKSATRNRKRLPPKTQSDPATSDRIGTLQSAKIAPYDLV
jgi:hypothetical protein